VLALTLVAVSSGPSPSLLERLTCSFNPPVHGLAHKLILGVPSTLSYHTAVQCSETREVVSPYASDSTDSWMKGLPDSSSYSGYIPEDHRNTQTKKTMNGAPTSHQVHVHLATFGCMAMAQSKKQAPPSSGMLRSEMIRGKTFQRNFLITLLWLVRCCFRKSRAEDWGGPILETEWFTTGLSGPKSEGTPSGQFLPPSARFGSENLSIWLAGWLLVYGVPSDLKTRRL
jgi:hypothetical protein